MKANKNVQKKNKCNELEQHMDSGMYQNLLSAHQSQYCGIKLPIVGYFHCHIITGPKGSIELVDCYPQARFHYCSDLK